MIKKIGVKDDLEKEEKQEENTIKFTGSEKKKSFREKLRDKKIEKKINKLLKKKATKDNKFLFVDDEEDINTYERPRVSILNIIVSVLFTIFMIMVFFFIIFVFYICNY